ncbi:MAG TPA: S41 family peptidase [Atopostipes sp.]|nr:S41 family peptidase [Atopostipes sp.]
MSKQDKNNKGFSISKKTYIITLIFALLIGAGGALAIGNYFSNDANKSEENLADIDSESDAYTQYLFGDSEELSSVNKMLTILETSYFEELDTEALIEGALDGMARATEDPYTEYLNEQETTSFEEDVSGSFQGIGAEVMKDGEFVRIVSPIANSPAEAAGLQPNDLIVEVDGESVAELTINEAVALIRGPEGSEVELLIQRGDNQFTISVTRATIPVETVFYEVDESDSTVGYVNIVNFNMPTYEETVEAIQDLESQGVTKIIFDVRGNPGGLLTTAMEISNIFVPNGEPITMTQNRDDEEPVVLEASEEFGDFKYDGEAILLVDEGSASASEILAGAMRSVGIPIYGTTTFGKGTVQSVVGLGATDELKFTSGKWLTADGEWINETGIEPDVTVELPEYATLFVVSPSDSFENGEASAEVSNLKSVLSALDYDVSETDVFDESVVDAIQNFQEENDLAVDGTITNDTARALTDALRAKIEENDTQYDAAVEAIK